MPQRGQQKWKVEANTNKVASSSRSSVVADAVTDRIGELSIAESQRPNNSQTIWKPKYYGPIANADVETMSETAATTSTAAALKNSTSLSKIFKGNLLENFIVDNLTYSLAQIRAVFYPKFQNETSDQEMFLKAWGITTGKKQVEFNDFLEVVVTAVTKLGNEKPKFYSTPGVIAFVGNGAF